MRPTTALVLFLWSFPATTVAETTGQTKINKRSYTLEADLALSGHESLAGRTVGCGFHLAATVKDRKVANAKGGVRFAFHYTESLAGRVAGCVVGCDSKKLSAGRIIGGTMGYVWQWTHAWVSIGAAIAVHEESARIEGKQTDMSSVVPGFSTAFGYQLPLTSRLAVQASLEIDTAIITWQGRAYLGVVSSF